jgi:RNA polymerase-binding protein DksA
MRQNELALSISKLKTERKKVLLKLTNLRQELSTQVDADNLEDLASDLTEHEMALTRIRELESRLKVIDEALQEVSQGTYGICQCCGEPIDPARLEIVPETTLCIRCKTTSEKAVGMKLRLSRSDWSQA